VRFHRLWQDRFSTPKRGALLVSQMRPLAYSPWVRLAKRGPTDPTCLRWVRSAKMPVGGLQPRSADCAPWARLAKMLPRGGTVDDQDQLVRAARYARRAMPARSSPLPGRPFLRRS